MGKRDIMQGFIITFFVICVQLVGDASGFDQQENLTITNLESTRPVFAHPEEPDWRVSKEGYEYQKSDEALTNLHKEHPHVQLARLYDEDIKKQREYIKLVFAKDKWIRRGLLLGGGLLGMAALIAALYQLRATEKLPFKFESFEDVINGFNGHEERIQKLELRPSIGSWAWYKSIASYILLSPAVLFEISIGSIKMGYNWLERRLYSTDVSWFVSHKTRLATLYKKGVNETEHYECELGLLYKDLEQSAMALDGMTHARLPVDMNYHRRHLVGTIEKLIYNLSLMLGYVDYVQEVKHADEAKQFEVESCSRYLVNCTNCFCDALEQALNQENAESIFPLIKAFGNELKQILVRFAN